MKKRSSGRSAHPSESDGASHVVADGVQLRVSTQGNGGTPLLLLNGVGCSFEALQPLREKLTHTRTIAIDMPGTGGTSPMRMPHPLCKFSNLVAGALDTLGIAEVDVLGVSWGGALAQDFTRRHPSRVRRAIFVSTSPGAISVLPFNPKIYWAMATPRRFYSRDYFRSVAPTLYGGSRHEAFRMGIRPHPLGYLYQIMALSGWTSTLWLRRVRQPSLVLLADDDPIIPLINGRLMARLLPQGRLHVVEKGGHLFLITHASEIAPIVESFLDEQVVDKAAA